MQNAHIIETALLLLIAFLIGCGIGWFVRTRFYGGPKTTQKLATSSTTPTATAAASAPVAAAAAPVAKPAVKKPAARKSAAPKAAAKKPVAKKASVKKTTNKKPITVAASAEPGRPKALSAPRDGDKDDLKLISGVGPKLEERLNSLGIYHFDQIAAWDRQTIDWVDNHLSFKGRIERDRWLEQAKAMAKK